MTSRGQLLKAFLRKEFLQILRDKRMRVILFVAPLMQLMVFGFALSTETRNIRLALVAPPTSTAMHDLYQHAIGSGWFIPAATTGIDPSEWVQGNEADVVLIEGSQTLERGQARGQAPIQVLINAQNSVRAQTIESYLLVIARQTFQPQAIPPLQFDVRALYNPTFKTAYFMVPGVLSMLVCLVTILLTSMAVAREREVGTLETLIASPIDEFDLLLGKTVPFIILGILQTPLIITFAVLMFGLPVRGPLWMLALASLMMVIATVAIGLLISTISRNQQQAMLGGFLYLFPSYLLSGLMFPIENMPWFVQPLARINPLTHYIDLLRNLLLMGGDLHFFIKKISILFVLTLILAGFALRQFRKMIHQS